MGQKVLVHCIEPNAPVGCSVVDDQVYAADIIFIPEYFRANTMNNFMVHIYINISYLPDYYFLYDYEISIITYALAGNSKPNVVALSSTLTMIMTRLDVT